MKAICFAIMKQLWPATRPVPAYDREYLRALRRQRQPQQRKCKFIVIRLLDSDSRVGVNTIYIYIYTCVCACHHRVSTERDIEFNFCLTVSLSRNQI